MKFPIAWHEECLKNMLASHQRDKEALERQQAYVESRWRDVEIYRQQIDEAKAKGKDGFDRYKFLKRRDAASLSPKEPK